MKHRISKTETENENHIPISFWGHRNDLRAPLCMELTFDMNNGARFTVADGSIERHQLHIRMHISLMR